MPIKYTQKTQFTWEASLNEKLIAVITMAISTPGNEKEISVMDYTTKEFLSPGQTFESINHAKAAIEYHFRDLLSQPEEFNH